MKVIKILLVLFLIPIVIAEPETCYNKIQNFGELGIDCDGPCNLGCPTCNDSFKNQGESKIDCGGPCKPCKETNFSLAMFTTILIVILIVLTFLYLVKKRTMNELQRYVEILRRKGYHKEQIDESLKKEGWSKKDILKACKEIWEQS